MDFQGVIDRSHQRAEEGPVVTTGLANWSPVEALLWEREGADDLRAQDAAGRVWTYSTRFDAVALAAGREHGWEEAQGVLLAARTWAREEHPAFAAMLRSARDLGWPEAWRDDLLVHDRRALREGPASDFVWQVRPTGTWLGLLREGSAWYQMSVLAAEAEYLYGVEQRWFRGSASGLLHPITPKEVMATFDADWTKRPAQARELAKDHVADIQGRTVLVTGVAASYGTMEATVRAMQVVGHREPGVPTRMRLDPQAPVVIREHPANAKQIQGAA